MAPEPVASWLRRSDSGALTGRPYPAAATDQARPCSSPTRVAFWRPPGGSHIVQCDRRRRYFTCDGSIPTETSVDAVAIHKILAKGSTSLKKAKTIFTLT